MKVLVLGAGMLAHYFKSFKPHFASKTWKDWDNFHIVDILELEGLREVLTRVDPEVVINAAAFGNIIACESHPELADNVNHRGQRNVIKVCNEKGIKLVSISTNSVFCGTTGNYSEEHIPHPGTVYGQSKLRGEEATRREAGDWAIFRITAIFGDYPGQKMDFVQKLIHELSLGNTLDCWDQVISPSYGPFVAKVIMKLLGRGVNGIWHIAGKEQLIRYEIGENIQRKLGKGRTRKVGTPVGLPLNRTLSIAKLKNELPDLEFPEFEKCVDELISTSLP